MNYIESLFRLKNKIAVVTGATGQLGKTFCKGFRQAGARVIGVDINIDVNILEGVDYYQMDISNKQQVHDVFTKIIEKYEKFDILVNNAGVSVFEPFEQRSEEKLDWVMDVNLKGTFFCIQAYVNLYDKYKLKSGSIVNVGSTFGVVSPDFRNYTDCDRKNSEIYGATKAGVIQMTKYFAVHLAERNIRINAISPGGIYNLRSPQGEDFIKNYSFRCPMKRMADEDEMIGAVLYLAGNAASYTTGQNIIIDGGTTCW
ncbi:MAG: SDR family oxidoreductase [Deltaproteobacteria bacterium]|nr:SDR family oxidoreductase [Deltaproteobacteria bacterium]